MKSLDAPWIRGRVKLALEAAKSTEALAGHNAIHAKASEGWSGHDRKEQA
jgi:hypothetical protein